MKLVRCAAALSLSLGVCASGLTASRLVSAQSGQTPGASTDRQEQDAAVERRALALLDATLDESRALRLVENRLHLQALAADLLWPRDRERARALFAAVVRELGEAMRGLDPADPQASQLAQGPLALRSEVLPLLARRDGRLALEFLRATRGPAGAVEPPYPRLDYESQLELNLAAQIAGEDPAQALRLAEESLNRGLSHQLLQVLSNLQSKDPEAAAKLTGEVTSRLQSINLQTNQEAAGLAFNLLQQMWARAQTPKGKSTPAAGPDFDERGFKELLDAIVTAALGLSLGGVQPHEFYATQNLFAQLKNLLPAVEKYLPARAPAVRRKIAEYDQARDPRLRASEEYQKLAQTQSFDALLEFADKAPPEMRPQFYAMAAARAAEQGDAERARQVLGERVTNPMERRRLLENLDRQEIWRAFNQGQLGEARRLLARLPNDQERAMNLIQWATGAGGRGEKEVARQLLDEARGLIASRARNFQEVHSSLQLARAYAGVEPAQSFELIERVIGQLNLLIAAAAVLDEFEQRGAFREDELRFQMGQQWGQFIRECAGTLGALARDDFERAASAADQFQRPEARLLARFSLAQGLLGEETRGPRAMRVLRPPIRR